jgi:hypothetical protein
MSKIGSLEMKWLSRVAPIASLASLALIGAARADFVCSNATLKGEYAFGVTNLTARQVVAGIKVFNGRGGLTQRDYQGNSVPPDFSPPGQETGTYIVDPDCTGSMVINLNVSGGGGGQIKILFVISDGGRHIHEVVSELTPPFASGPVPVQTSADDWKVAPASEQDNQ